MVENITGLLARVLKGSFKFETIFPEGKILDSSSADQLSTFYFLEKNIFIFFLRKGSKYSKLHYHKSFLKLYALLEKCFHGFLHSFATNRTLPLFGLHNCITALLTKRQVSAIHEDIHTFWSF